MGTAPRSSGPSWRSESSRRSAAASQRDRIGMVRGPGRDPERSESLALAQLLIVSHLVGAFDGAFEL